MSLVFKDGDCTTGVYKLGTSCCGMFSVGARTFVQGCSQRDLSYAWQELLSCEAVYN